jgi:YhcH/YjgK/YiaL family protein
MIIDQLSNSGIYEGLSAGLASAFDFLRRNAGSPPPEGRYEIDGDRIYALVQRYLTRPADGQKSESHRKYLDVQYVASGREAMGWAQKGALEPDGEYDAQKDRILYKDGPAAMLPCPEGTFAVFFPDDLHKPCCALGESCPVVKIVVKVRLD